MGGGAPRDSSLSYNSGLGPQPAVVLLQAATVPKALLCLSGCLKVRPWTAGSRGGIGAEGTQWGHEDSLSGTC